MKMQKEISCDYFIEVGEASETDSLLEQHRTQVPLRLTGRRERRRFVVGAFKNLVTLQDLLDKYQNRNAKILEAFGDGVYNEERGRECIYSEGAKRGEEDERTRKLERTARPILLQRLSSA